jgi:GT2 family glycosyltransferase
MRQASFRTLLKLDERMTLPSVAVIIPTRGRPGPLKTCLRQIFPYVNQHSECMIVVSDDGDASETSAALAAEFPEVNVVQGPHRGPAANRNWGAAHSMGELLIFLDDDCRPVPDLVAEYQRAANSNPECSLFEGRITAEGIETGFADTTPSNEKGGYLWSCNFGIRRELFIDIGGFDERFPFPAMEDADLHFRVSAKSPILFLSGARVYHAFERRAGWRAAKHHTLSLLLYMHLHGLKATQRGPRFFVRSAARLAFSGGVRIFRRRAAKDPQHLLLSIWICVQLLLITLFWKFHPYLARKFFPACCAGCRSIHASFVNQ